MNPVAVPAAIDRRHVEAAAAKWKREGGYGNFQDSRRYDVLIKDVPYPPKAICSIALHLATGQHLAPADFKGVKDGPWHTRLKELGFDVVEKSGPAKPVARKAAGTQLKKDLAALERELASSALAGNERDAVVKARLNAGKLRRAVLASFGDRCCLTGVDDARLLVCSHIVPWSRCSSPAQQVDAQNTLLLFAGWDALFDRHLVSFDDQGRLVLSRSLGDGSILRKAGLRGTARLAPRWLTPARRAYLRQHREKTLAPQP